MKTYLISWAQNATPIHRDFWAAAKTFAKETKAELIVIPGRYKNPTSKWSKQQEDEEWWDEAVEPYLLTTRRSLCPNLKVFGDTSVQPTAKRPLGGLDDMTGTNSIIVGHPARALEVVPTGSRTPRVMWTTSACTVTNYTKSKAGIRGQHHHVIGALVVEVQTDGKYFCRHVTFDEKTKSFTDLDRRYTRDGATKAPASLGLVAGDIHVHWSDTQHLKALNGLIEATKPETLVFHDTLDFKSRTHHESSTRFMYVKRDTLVDSEVREAAEFLKIYAKKAKYLKIVRSNHDEFLDRWLEECNPKTDLANAPYYHQLWSRVFAHQSKNGKWPNCFELESRRYGVPQNVTFLKRDESFRIRDIECGFHGDKGLNGARGTPNAYAKLGQKTITGHVHTPRIVDGAFVVGVTGALFMGYNALPSGWMNAHVLIHSDGKRQLVICVEGRFRGQ